MDKSEEMKVEQKGSDRKKERRKKERKTKERKKERKKVSDFHCLKLCTGDVSNKLKICGQEAIYQLPVSRNRGLGNTVDCKTKFFDVIIFRC